MIVPNRNAVQMKHRCRQCNWLDTVKDVAAYFSGSLDTERHQQIEEKLVAAEKLNHPEKTEAEIYTQLDECTRATEDEKA